MLGRDIWEIGWRGGSWRKVDKRKGIEMVMVMLMGKDGVVLML